MFNLKKDFPLFERYPELVYLDSAATAQKPAVVLEAITKYYQTNCANVHRGVHKLSDQSTLAFEQAKSQIAEFFGAKTNQLILTRNATEALNGIAYGWADHNLQAGDIILTSLMEHHANLVPWQEVCKRTGAKLKFIELTNLGQLDLTDLDKKISLDGHQIKLISLTHISNTLGIVNPIEEISKKIKQSGLNIKLAIDGAQSAPHLKINFEQLGADFYAFSGHKMLGPMGSGGLIVNQKLLKAEKMKPWLFGGGMIDSVYPEKTSFNENISERFIAGTPDVASTIGLAKACQYLSDLSMDQVKQHNQSLVEYALKQLSQIKELSLVGPTDIKQRLGSVALIYDQVHAHDVAQVLDSANIAVRSGHHCTMPLHAHFGWQATVRASFSVYNDFNDVDQLVTGLKKVKQIFKK